MRLKTVQIKDTTKVDILREGVVLTDLLSERIGEHKAIAIFPEEIDSLIEILTEAKTLIEASK